MIDRYPAEDIFARVPELAGQTDPVLRQLDQVLDDDQLFHLVKTDLSHRYPQKLCHGRHSTPVEVILRMLVIKHLFNWGEEETEQRVADRRGLDAGAPYCRSGYSRSALAGPLAGTHSCADRPPRT